MRKEIELKFEVTPQDLRKLRGARVLRRKPLKEEDLVSVYFDTPKHKLARNDVLPTHKSKDPSEASPGSCTHVYRTGAWGAGA
jgi:CYTH domain